MIIYSMNTQIMQHIYYITIYTKNMVEVTVRKEIAMDTGCG